MLHSPLVSVVCAVYNGEDSLRRSIDSVLGQTYQNWELIMVNDGSKDATVNIIEEYSRNDQRIRLINNEQNLGQTASLNKGIHNARGEYIARIDSDDVFSPGKLALQVAFMDAHPNVVLCGTNAICSDADTGIDSEIRFPEGNYEILSGLFSHSSIIHVSVLMRKDSLLKVGDYNTRYHVAADYELWVRFAQEGLVMHNIQEATVTFNFSAGSFGRTNMERTVREFNEVNLTYLLWAIENPAKVPVLARLATFGLPQGFLTFKQVMTIYAHIISLLVKNNRFSTAAKNVLRLFNSIYYRSRIQKFTHGVLDRTATRGTGLYLFLIMYPVFALMKGLKQSKDPLTGLNR